MLTNDCLVEHDAHDNEGEARTRPFTTDDTIYLAEAVKLVLLVLDTDDGILNNLRDILVTLDLCMWMSLAPEESEQNQRREYGPPEDVVTKVLQFVFSNECFAENTKKKKRVTTFNTETGQFGNSGMVEVAADVDADQGTVTDGVMGNQQGAEVAVQQPIGQNPHLPSPPSLFSVPWCTGIQPAPEDDMSMGSNNDGEGYEGV